MPQIRIKNLFYLYKDVYALNGINFTINEGEFVNIVGSSGGGKTTLLKCIAGILTPTTGEIFFDDELVNFKKARHRDVSMIFQEFDLFPSQTVFENIMTPLDAKKKLSFDDKSDKVWRMLKKLDIEVIANQFPKELSYGQKQKVALAKALISEPKIILFDEPLSNIDESKKMDYKKLILEAKKLFPESTYLYVTHNINDALMLGNRTLIIEQGQIHEFSLTQLMYRYPSSLKTLQLMRGYYQDKVQTINEEQLTTLQKLLNDKDNHSFKYVEVENETFLFDQQGNTISGPRKTYPLDAKLTEESLQLGDEVYDLKDLKNGVLEIGCVMINLDKDKFLYEDNGFSLRLVCKVVYFDKFITVFQYQTTNICLYTTKDYEIDDEVVLYYPLLEINVLSKNGDKCLSFYYLEKNICLAKVINHHKGIIKVANYKMQLKQPLEKRKQIKLEFEKDAFKIDRKKGLKVIMVINEEYLGSKTLIYAYVKHFEGYVNFIIDGTKKLLNQKIRLIPYVNKIKIIDQ